VLVIAQGFKKSRNQSRSDRQRQHGLRKRIVVCFAVLLLMSDLPVRSQQTATIAVDVNAVNLLATVRDKKGTVVRDLGKDDFVLEQDGKPQTISYFAKESGLPLTLGLLVDTSMSQRRVLDQELAASRSFLDHVLREDRDKAFVIHFEHEVVLDQELTASRQKLQTALDQINRPGFSQSGSGGGSSGSGGGGGRGSHGGRGGSGAGTLLYDAVFLAADEVMKKQQGRKALIVLTDGQDRGSKETLEQAVEAAQRADTLVYGILFADKEGYGNAGGYGGRGMGGHGGRGGGYPGRREESHPDGKKVLEEISKASGGRFFEVSKKEPIDKIYAAIDEELRSQYSLGYTVDKAATSAGYHKLSLAVKQKDMIVQTRDGFYFSQP
jgi:VWFA-related protein